MMMMMMCICSLSDLLYKLYTHHQKSRMLIYMMNIICERHQKNQTKDRVAGVGPFNVVFFIFIIYSYWLYLPSVKTPQVNFCNFTFECRMYFFLSWKKNIRSGLVCDRMQNIYTRPTSIHIHTRVQCAFLQINNPAEFQ